MNCPCCPHPLTMPEGGIAYCQGCGWGTPEWWEKHPPKEDDGVALTSTRHPPGFDTDAEVPGIHTELDLLSGAVREISANEEKLVEVVTRHFMQELGQCEGACTWHVVFGWAPEAGCPVHDPDG